MNYVYAMFYFSLAVCMCVYLVYVSVCARAMKIIFSCCYFKSFFFSVSRSGCCYLIHCHLSIFILQCLKILMWWVSSSSTIFFTAFISLQFFQVNWEYYFAFIEFEAFLFCLHFSFLFPVISIFSSFCRLVGLFVFSSCYFSLVCTSHYVFFHINLFFLSLCCFDLELRSLLTLSQHRFFFHSLTFYLSFTHCFCHYVYLSLIPVFNFSMAKKDRTLFF